MSHLSRERNHSFIPESAIVIAPLQFIVRAEKICDSINAFYSIVNISSIRIFFLLSFFFPFEVGNNFIEGKILMKCSMVVFSYFLMKVIFSFQRREHFKASAQILSIYGVYSVTHRTTHYYMLIMCFCDRLLSQSPTIQSHPTA